MYGSYLNLTYLLIPGSTVPHNTPDSLRRPRRIRIEYQVEGNALGATFSGSLYNVQSLRVPEPGAAAFGYFDGSATAFNILHLVKSDRTDYLSMLNLKQ